MTLYPFSAIVGQDNLKKALLLCAIHPGIGGVLIKGEKGTAKTTAVRGLAAIMPPWQEDGGAIPFVDLPLGASEDRVLGSLDIEAILSQKSKKLLPGLLADAHEGILYIDEVNLLADHLVDILLDVAASGVNTVQREGLSVSHQARFILIGTMNPEEGNLRPQFLDRFGLMVEVGAPADVQDRSEVVRRRIAYEAEPDVFAGQWAFNQEHLRAQVSKARELLPRVQMPDGLLTMISQLCIEWGVKSLRADIVMYKTAIAIAAFNGRIAVVPKDVKEAAELVLMHRRGKNAPPLQGGPDEYEQNPKTENEESAGTPPNLTDSAENGTMEKPETDCGEGNCADDEDTNIAGIDFGMIVPELPKAGINSAAQLADGQAIKARQTSKGMQVRAIKRENPSSVAVNETLLHALSRSPDRLHVQRSDLHERVRNGKTGDLILFVVDASGSMAAGRRMEAVKGSVMHLLQEAYQKRNAVGVVTFRGVEASVLLEPTRHVELAEQALQSLPTGGRTPLPHALQLATEVLSPYIKAGIQPFLVILSDGKANVPLPGSGGDAWRQSLELAQGLGQRALVLDTETGYVRYGKARDLAAALGAEYLSLDDLTAEAIIEIISGRISRNQQ